MIYFGSRDMKNPRLKFRLNQKLDTEMALDFYNNPVRAGYDFWQSAVELHDDLAVLKKYKNKKVFITKYLDKLYIEHSDEFEIRTKKIEKIYRKKEKQFFKTTNLIFKKHPWPKGKYICYPSVFSFGPRFLKDKTLQVFLYDTDNLILFTIFHEMTHFIFYDYAFKKYPETLRRLDPDKGVFWTLAEIFNSIMHTTQPFIRLHGKINKPYYPEHKKYLPTLKRHWQKDKDIDKWLVKSLKYLKSQ